MSATRRSARTARRRASRRRRLAVALGSTAALAVLGAAGYGVLNGVAHGGGGPATVQARAVPPLTESPPPQDTAPEPSAQPSNTPPSSQAPSSQTPSSGAGQGRGDGTFNTAEAAGSAVGQGTVRRYKVEVENGIGIDPKAAAAVVQAVLADPRGWTADGHDGFQLVSSGTYDFTVRIASPDTVDRICGSAGLDTKGEVNCDVGKQVMVNSKRWQTGSPQFSGSLDDYRALIVNHEVGHRIGHGHEGCPGPGKPAPAMMQQIYGLDGCVANAWPYGADGHYLGGPSVP
ncbi:DUF3152 domain-containing protein [Kitasatospora sp. NPDC049285]|uniref:DUF3152 domain-containing protein n=1 Tax=Kitasatospora sp. NPDC049285 TaxID=3157096 RepID=UPI0034375539